MSFISALSISGLVLGVSLLVLVLSVMNGFDRELRQSILGLMPEAALYHRYGIEDVSAVQAQLESHESVDATAPFVHLQVLLSRRQAVSPVNLYGVDIAQEPKVSILPSKLTAESKEALAANRPGLILGAGLAASLKAEVGDKLTLVVPALAQKQSPKVKVLPVLGVFSTGTEVDNGLALMALSAAQTLSDKPDGVTGLRLKTQDLFAAPQLVAELVRSLPYGFYGTDWTRTHGNLFQAIQMSKNLVGLLLFLIIAIAAFNVVSTLIMVVVDKQADIAILRTLGAGTGTIMAIFMVQGSLIGLIGTALGLGFGVLLCSVASEVFTYLELLFNVQFLKSDVYPISYLPVDLRWPDVALIAVVALLMSFLATLYPAWRASRVQPAEALRYE
mgnify:CR=1 FL=1